LEAALDEHVLITTNT